MSGFGDRAKFIQNTCDQKTQKKSRKEELFHVVTTIVEKEENMKSKTEIKRG